MSRSGPWSRMVLLSVIILRLNLKPNILQFELKFVLIRPIIPCTLSLLQHNLCVALNIFGNLFDECNTEVVLYETK